MNARAALGVVVKGLAATPMFAFPIVVWGGLAHGSTRQAAYVVLGAMLVTMTFAFRGRKEKGWAGLLAALSLPLATTTLAVVAIWLGDHRFLLVTPTLVNAALFVSFAWSLRRPRTPVIERFARAMHGDLEPARVAYCRRVTMVWTGFFAVNGIICSWAALSASVSFWAIYTGGISYGLVGLLFCGEYVVRRMRFG